MTAIQVSTGTPVQALNLPAENRSPPGVQPTDGGHGGQDAYAPATTPEGNATNQAATDLQGAAEALANMQGLARQGQNFAQAELDAGYLQQNVASARADLASAVGAEIDALMEADPGLTREQAAGIVASRFEGTPVAADVTDAIADADVQSAVDATIDGVDQSQGPEAALSGLDDALAGLPPDVRERVIADPRVQQWIEDAAARATEPLAPYIGPDATSDGREGEAVVSALQRLSWTTGELSPELAAAVLDAALGDFEQLPLARHGGGIYPNPMNTGSLDLVVQLASYVATAGNGQDLIGRLIALNGGNGGWEYATDAVQLSTNGDPRFSTTVGPALFVELERLGIPLTANGESPVVYAMGPILDDVHGTIQGHAEDYYGLVETLQFAQQMRPLYGSDAEFEAALDTLMRDKIGDDWQVQVESAQQALATDGSRLLGQLQQFMALPADHPLRVEVDALVNDILADPAAQAAIGFALRSDPSLVQGRSGELLLEMFATPGLDAGARGLAVEFGNAWISARTGPALAALDPADPASIAEFERQLSALDDPRLAAALGVDPAALEGAVAALVEAAPALAGDQAQQQAAQRTLNGALNDIDGFSADDAAGQVFRGLALSASGSAFMNANDLQVDDPRVETFLDAAIGNLEFMKGANFSAKALIGVAVNAEVIAGGSLVGKYGLGNAGVGRLLAAVGIASDTWQAIQAFGDGDVPGGVLHATAAGGVLAGLLGAGTWLGPVGWAVAALSYVGLGALEQARHNNRFETDAMREFLAASNLSDAAAAELFNTTGNAVSPVPFLLHYAQQQGLSVEQAIAWFNTLADSGELKFVVELAHRTIDAAGDDGTGLPATHESDAELERELAAPGANIVGIVLSHEPASCAQLDMLLEAADIPLPG